MYIHTTDHMTKCWEGAFVANWCRNSSNKAKKKQQRMRSVVPNFDPHQTTTLQWMAPLYMLLLQLLKFSQVFFF